MKSTELRIGNLIRKGVRCGVITASDIFDLSKVNLGFNDSEYVKSWKPIPLTEEWILKLGFKFRSERLCTIGYFEIHILEGVYFVKSYYLIKIQYVHQLQNLYFALTGEELTIND